MKEKRFTEAVERMKLLNLSPRCIEAFCKGKVWESEGYGALYEVNQDEQKLIDEFERKYNALVYHMIHNKFEFGECYTMLYVSNDKAEWESDRQDLKEGYALCYVKNIDDDFCSEFGTVAIKPNIGGLVRLY